MRVTSRRGGTLSTVSKVIVPSPDTSRHAGPPAPCPTISADFTSDLQRGVDATSVIAAQTRSGGAATCTVRVATWFTGSEYPTARTIATIAASDPTTINSQRMAAP